MSSSASCARWSWSRPSLRAAEGGAHVVLGSAPSDHPRRGRRRRRRRRGAGRKEETAALAAAPGAVAHEVPLRVALAAFETHLVRARG
eukprot:9466919-Pyramimonas_sp.AAC.1